MAHIFCIANQKGGVGKTTTTVNLAAGLARIGQRVLLVDLDPQGNATMGSGVDKRAMALSVYDVLLESCSIAEAASVPERLKEAGAGYAVLGANRELAGAEVELVGEERRERRLKQALTAVDADYDFVLIDCPPSLGQLTRTALSGATEVLMPIQCEYFAMEGLTQMIEVIRDVMRRNPRRLRFGGILLTMYDHTLELTHEVDAEVRDFFGEIVFQTVIPRDVAVSEAPSHGLSVLDYDPRARGARAYAELCLEVLQRE
jgi:chromosome partitioning protein